MSKVVVIDAVALVLRYVLKEVSTNESSYFKIINFVSGNHLMALFVCCIILNNNTF